MGVELTGTPSGTYLPSHNMAYTCDPAQLVAGVALNANGASYMRVKGGKQTITKIGLHVTVSSGNISVAVLRGAGGRTNPTSRVATSGVVVCPSVGYAEVSLGGSVDVDPATDWFAISSDNATAKFLSPLTALVLSASGIGQGLAAREFSAHPIPSTPTPTSAYGSTICLVGVA